jgi:hypothetical protein
MPNKKGIAVTTAPSCLLQLALTLQVLLSAAAAHVISSAQGETDHGITTTAAAMCNCLTVVCALKCAAQRSALLLQQQHYSATIALQCTACMHVCMYCLELKQVIFIEAHLL